MISDEHNRRPRMSREAIELTAVITGAIAAVCSILQFIVWLVHLI
jgi:hypothetical protein